MTESEIREILKGLARDMKRIEVNFADILETLDPAQAPSAVNMIHYLTLRSHDIRELQDSLHALGLSSLASSESHTLRQIQAILLRLGEELTSDVLSPVDARAGRQMIRDHARCLFGSTQEVEHPAIMVTFDAGFVRDYRFIENLLLNGMKVARINCAHDDPETWARMIELLRLAMQNNALDCRIYMDLPGPKLRTLLFQDGVVMERVAVEPGQMLWFCEPEACNNKGVSICCEEKGVTALLEKGQRVLFDDGIIEGRIEALQERGCFLKIIRVSDRKQVLRSGKGINFPDADLALPALTEFDRTVLPFIMQYADLVGYSFIRNAADLQQLQQMMNEYQRKPHIIIKVETSDAVTNLPALILQGMQEEVFGVMIARGDLAVEIGFERLSEIQEEIGWICESAHVPVIWATQVLDHLNKTGIATRSEITDAYHASLSECVMINKGPHILHVLKVLTDIFRRSGGHHVKKRYTFKSMQIARRFLEPSLIIPDKS